MTKSQSPIECEQLHPGIEVSNLAVALDFYVSKLGFRDVPVRLEKRLTALLQDLAVHKRMSVNSCLEEMILHTNDGVGPHTRTTLRYIEELKKKHGIDDDSHGSYRFVEE